MSNFLEQAVIESKRRVDQWRRENFLETLQDHSIASRQPISMAKTLREAAPIGVIAEIKRASPSRGVLNESVNLAERAVSYMNGGASAISVLTEPKWFLGSIDDLMIARKAVERPILRKDFIVDEYDLAVSRIAGADAVLLVVACLGASRLKDLLREARAYSLDALVEVHDVAELEIALRADAEIIGVNSRNLRTLKVDVESALFVMKQVAPDRVRVFESGIQNREDVQKALDAGANAVLIGETLMRADDPRSMLKHLLSGIRLTSGTHRSDTKCCGTE